MGKKYVIEIAEEFTGDKSEKLYRVKGFNSLVFDQNGLDKLKPLEKCIDACVAEFTTAYNDGFEAGRASALKDIQEFISYSSECVGPTEECHCDHDQCKCAHSDDKKDDPKKESQKREVLRDVFSRLYGEFIKELPDDDPLILRIVHLWDA